jgi:hypothetical protein
MEEIHEFPLHRAGVSVKKIHGFSLRDATCCKENS